MPRVSTTWRSQNTNAVNPRHDAAFSARSSRWRPFSSASAIALRNGTTMTRMRLFTAAVASFLEGELLLAVRRDDGLVALVRGQRLGVVGPVVAVHDVADRQEESADR